MDQLLVDLQSLHDQGAGALVERSHFLRSLGAYLADHHQHSDQPRAYQSLLAAPMIVLDDAADAEQVALLQAAQLPRIRDEPAAASVTLDGPHRLTLNVLSTDKAQLLPRRNPRPQPVRTVPPPARELASVCTYLPLSLRIAARPA